MLLHLVKKDFLIVKKYVLLMLVVSILIPPLMLWRVPQYAGTLGFVLAEIFAVCMLLQYVSLKEFQYQHAAMLLNAAPYSRTQMVLSKYVFCLVIFAVCAVVFFIETLLFSQLGSLNGMMAAGTLLVLACFVGIYLPVQYRFGYEKKICFCCDHYGVAFHSARLAEDETIGGAGILGASAGNSIGIMHGDTGAVYLGGFGFCVSAFLSLCGIGMREVSL